MEMAYRSLHLVDRKCCFLDLPIEIRNDIYHIALQNAFESSEAYYSITLTCRQIRREAFPIIISARHFKFEKRGLLQFLAWAKRGLPEHLELVKRISITFQEECYTTMAKSLCRTHEIPEGFDPSTEIYWETRYAQLFTLDHQARTKLDDLVDPGLSSGAISLIWTTLVSLPNVNVFELDFSYIFNSLYPTSRNSKRFEFAIEQQIILEMLSSAFPTLPHLGVFPAKSSLAYLRGFSHLKYLSTNGIPPFLTTLADESVLALLSLKHLDSLYLRSSYSNRGFGRWPEPLRDFVPDVVPQMRPLKYFGSEEVSSRMLTAIRTHLRSLQRVEMFSPWRQFCKRRELVMELLDFAATSPIPNIHLRVDISTELAGMDHQSLVPKTEKRIEVFLFSRSERSERSASGESVIVQYLEIRTGKYFRQKGNEKLTIAFSREEGTAEKWTSSGVALSSPLPL